MNDIFYLQRLVLVALSLTFSSGFPLRTQYKELNNNFRAKFQLAAPLTKNLQVEKDGFEETEPGYMSCVTGMKFVIGQRIYLKK